jgi:hypothetical protein
MDSYADVAQEYQGIFRFICNGIGNLPGRHPNDKRSTTA